MNLDSGVKNLDSHTSDYISIFMNCVNSMFCMGLFPKFEKITESQEPH